MILIALKLNVNYNCLNLFVIEAMKVNTEKINKILDILLKVISIIAVISIVLKYGFYIPVYVDKIINYFDQTIIVFYLIQYLIKFISQKNKLSYIKVHKFETILAAAVLFFGFLLIIRLIGYQIIDERLYDTNIKIITKVYVIIAQLIILFYFVPDIIKYNKKVSKLKVHPGIVLLLSFLFIIITGTFLLMLPRAVNIPYKISFINALFTSTSATCVTGLIVVDTPVYFSLFGQLIILGLIQIGGIGIMTISSFLTIFFGRGISIRERVFLFDMLSTDHFEIITSTIKNIIKLVLFIELIGALLLMIVWHKEGWQLGILIYNSIFHSVSAFCNAGFSSFSNNLIDYRSNLFINIIIGSEIILGGLGFVVLMDIGFSRIMNKNVIKQKKYKLQTKLVLIVSGILILIGALFFIVIEYDKEENFLTNLITGFFTSISARTAGFNTIDVHNVSSSMSLVLIILMFIGASPGSTGGGIKTTTFAILLISIFSILIGKKRIVLFNKNIPFVVLNRALIVFIIAISLICLSLFILTISENSNFLDILFETTSAFGTVGLSRGITSTLTIFGRIIIILCMFIGRLGILTLAFAITPQKEQVERVEYPSEMVNVG